MKKCTLFVTLILVLALTVTACGQKNPFPGAWRGTCDLTDFIVESVSGGNEDIEKYLEFENLALEFVYEFDENQVVTSVDEASFTRFSKDFKNGFMEAVKEKLINDLEQEGLSYEEYVYEAGVDEEELILSKLEDVNLDTWLESIHSLAEAMELNGTYMRSDDALTVLFEDGTYNKLQYRIDGKKLTIIITDGEIELPIICEKQ